MRSPGYDKYKFIKKIIDSRKESNSRKLYKVSLSHYNFKFSGSNLSKQTIKFKVTKSLVKRRKKEYKIKINITKSYVYDPINVEIAERLYQEAIVELVLEELKRRNKARID